MYTQCYKLCPPLIWVLTLQHIPDLHRFRLLRPEQPEKNKRKRIRQNKRWESKQKNRSEIKAGLRIGIGPIPSADRSRSSSPLATADQGRKINPSKLGFLTCRWSNRSEPNGSAIPVVGVGEGERNCRRGRGLGEPIEEVEEPCISLEFHSDVLIRGGFSFLFLRVLLPRKDFFLKKTWDNGNRGFKYDSK
jgi:hypothetical protein